MELGRADIPEAVRLTSWNDQRLTSLYGLRLLVEPYFGDPIENG
jgi:hypothetical protein